MKTRKNRGIIDLGLLKVLLIAIYGFPVYGSDLVLVKDGEAYASIYIEEKATITEEFAAQELQWYLKRITGATLPIHRGDQSQSGPRILVGYTPNSLNLDLSREQVGKDGFVIKKTGTELYLIGREDRGTLYSVYALLEELGCRFFAPEFDYYDGNHELIPERSTIAIGELDIVEKPAFPLRMEHARQIARYRVGEPSDMVPILDWMAKNRMNVLQTGLPFILDEDFEEARRALKKRGLLFASGSHDDWREALPMEKYREAHPEWYARTPDGHHIGTSGSGIRSGSRGAPCATNREAVRMLAIQYLDIMESRPLSDIVIPEMPDGSWYCQCERCTQLEQDTSRSADEADIHARLKGKALKRYLTIVDPILQRMQVTFPDKMVMPFLYNEALGVPSGEFELTSYRKENVTVWWTNWARDKRYPLDVSATVQPRLNAMYHGVKLWQEAGVSALVSAHWVKYHTRSWPDINIGLMMEDFHILKEDIRAAGVSLFDAVPANWYAHEITHYAFARGAWNPDQTTYEVLTDYCQARFSEAWASMVAFFTQMEKAMDYRSNGGRVPDNPLQVLPPLLTQLERAAGHLDRAEARTTDPEVLDLLSRWRWSLTYVSNDVKAIYYEERFKEEREIEDLEKAVSAQRIIMEEDLDNSDGIILKDHGSFQRHHTGIPTRLAQNDQIVQSIRQPDPDNLALAGNGGTILSAPKGLRPPWFGREAIIDGVKGDGLFETFDISGRRIPHYLYRNRQDGIKEPVSIKIGLDTTAVINEVRIWQIEGRMAEEVVVSIAVGEEDYKELGTFELFADPVNGQRIEFSPQKADMVQLLFSDIQDSARLGLVEVGVYKSQATQ